MSRAERPSGRGPILGAGIGSTIGVVAAIGCAALVAIAVALFARSRQGRGLSAR